MASTLDLTGKRFGYLTCIRVAGRHRTNNMWLCRCDCGNDVIVQARHVKSGHTRSCGHLRQAAIPSHGIFVAALARRIVAEEREAAYQALRREQDG